MRVKSMSHAGLTVSDLGRAVRWYHEQFGFYLVSEDVLEPEATKELFPLYRVEGARLRMGFLRAPGGGVVELFQFEPAAARPGGDNHPAWNAPGFTHVALNVSKLGAWVERLEERGVKFVTKPARTGKVDWAFLKDPDGNLVELIDLKAARPALRLVGGLLGAALKRGRFSAYYR
ncbi:MAG TPA: VOC family protein [Spirochaetales bacterium]|nr:VOC family protein [Spirochaetales bacterium]HRY53855.1 VOC family protein [Spirochaetia bacterium]HRZ64707.1 VOC family protein [Spirochaetia bacterium]